MRCALHSFGYALDYLRELVADVAPSDMVAQRPPFNAHPAWVVGHLTGSCQLLGEVIGLTPWLPKDWFDRFGPRSVPVAEARQYESKETLLARLTDGQSRITSAVETLYHTALDAAFADASYRAVFPTVRHALTQVLIGHTAYHVGRLAAWCAAMGIKPIDRGFE